MLSKEIRSGAVFIVFDLEWNQPLPGRHYGFDTSRLTGEIIEIGAVRYIYDDGVLRPDGVFSRDIKPVRYRKLHFHVKKVTGKSDSDLEKGIPFKVAYDEFKSFCGAEAILGGWSGSDTDMLRMNLRFFGEDDRLNMEFVDVQHLFSYFSTEKGRQRSVEFAVDYYQIPKSESFHSATSDAVYTGKILENIFLRNKPSEVMSVISSSAVNPDIRREYAAAGTPCRSPQQALSMVSGFDSVCPVCGREFENVVPAFTIRKSTYGLYKCPEDGQFYSRIRIKKNRDGLFYAASVLRIASAGDCTLIASKKEEYDKFGSKGRPADQVFVDGTSVSGEK